jgi:hypothetical protein
MKVYDIDLAHTLSSEASNYNNPEPVEAKFVAKKTFPSYKSIGYTKLLNVPNTNFV